MLVAAVPRGLHQHLEHIELSVGMLDNNPVLRQKPSVPGAFDGYEMAVRAILGQQISVQAATTLAGRFAAKFGEKAETPFPQLTHHTPKAKRVASAEAQEIIALGIISNRANSILRLSQEVASGSLSLEPDADPDTTIARLCELPGIGAWTAQCVAMRALGHADAFPHTDLGIKKALGETNPKRILERAEAWRPYPRLCDDAPLEITGKDCLNSGRTAKVRENRFRGSSGDALSRSPDESITYLSNQPKEMRHFSMRWKSNSSKKYRKTFERLLNHLSGCSFR